MGPATLRNMDEKKYSYGKNQTVIKHVLPFFLQFAKRKLHETPLRMEMTESFIMSPLGLGPTAKLMSLMTLASFGRRVWGRPREHGFR